MNNFENQFYRIFPEAKQREIIMSLDPNRVRKKLKEMSEDNEKIQIILDKNRKYFKKIGLSSKQIKNKLDRLEMYLQYQHGTGIPFGDPAYVSDGLVIYPDGHMEDGW